MVALRLQPGVTVAEPAAAGGVRRFGSNSLRVNDKIFAMVAARGRFVVKLPERRVDEIIASGRGEPFDPTGQRRMKQWVAMAPGTAREWIALADEAMTFVSAPSRR